MLLPSSSSECNVTEYKYEQEGHHHTAETKPIIWLAEGHIPSLISTNGIYRVIVQLYKQ